MDTRQPSTERRVAVLVDCDNTSPAVLEHALKIIAQFGRIVVKRGYGTHATFAGKWQEALVRLAFTPCLQFAYAPGKNTADIALALDAYETMFDQRADSFCLVTSDSDFAYLSRKLKERGAIVYIVGEAKTPSALRNASDQFFEYLPEVLAEPCASAPLRPLKTGTQEGAAAPGEPLPKRRPKFLIDAVALLSSDSAEGLVALGTLGQYLKRTDPAFSPKTFGHAGLLEMVKTYDLLALKKETGGHYTVKALVAPEPRAALRSAQV